MTSDDRKAKQNAKARRYYERHPEKLRARAKAYRKANPEKARAADKASKAKALKSRWHIMAAQHFTHPSKVARFGPPDIDGDYMLDLFEQQQGLCYWLGIPMVPSGGKRDPQRPSVDRLDNSKGYVRGNVVLACMFANMGRSQLEADWFRVFVEVLRARMPR